MSVSELVRRCRRALYVLRGDDPLAARVERNEAQLSAIAEALSHLSTRGRR